MAMPVKPYLVCLGQGATPSPLWSYKGAAISQKATLSHDLITRKSPLGDP